MNEKAIAYILGVVLQFEGVFMLIPFLVSIYYGDGMWKAFLVPASLSLIFGMMIKFYSSKSSTFYAKEGFIIVAASWILLSLIGAVPFYMGGCIDSYLDAVFESIAGFTTTGASILTNIQALPRSILFWRSITNWVGGMGVLVFIIAVLPQTGAYNMHLMKAESPGPSVGKLVPKVKETAIILYAIYIFITALEFVFLYLGGMPLFDAITTSFATAGTGGFGVLNDSMASYSYYAQNVVAIFMVLYGVNFNLYFMILLKRSIVFLKSEEVRTYFAIVLGATLLIAMDIYGMYGNVWTSIRMAFFHVASLITSTGFTIADYNTWPAFSQTILVLLMFVGACASSTGCGIKVSRIILYCKVVKKELRSFVHPNSVRAIKLDGRPVDPAVTSACGGFLMVYMMVFVVSLVLISVDNYDITTNFTAVSAALNNVGTGLGAIGPGRNFADFSVLSKIVFMFDMLAGRLEIFPLLVLFAPRSWGR